MMQEPILTEARLDEIIMRDYIFGTRKYPEHGDKNHLLLTDPYYRLKRVLLTLQGVDSKIFARACTWLDLGCNAGQFPSILSQLGSLRVAGIDDWDLPGRYPLIAFDYKSFDISRDWVLELRAQLFDCISALELIEHMIDTDSFLERCYSQLSSDGLLIISTPNINSLRNRLIVPFGKYPAGLEYKNTIHHVRLYNLNTMKRQLREHGFEVMRAVGVHFLPERMHGYRPLKRVSAFLADLLPQMCSNLIIIARKLGSAAAFA